MTDDATLLQRYATERAEDAFAELVRRNLPLVYSAALRRLGGDAHRAQDVAQVVFCSLAREAPRVARYPVITGWLYTATRNAVIDVLRSEKRRRVREEEAHTMQQIGSDSPADWSQLRPVLDSAMDQLSERDREAVLLRFFQNRPFAEIGAAIGLSEDAARKRVERALDQLRDVLKPRGIASTSGALATLLTTQAIGATPAALAGSITGAALATGGAAAAATTAFFALTKLQTGIAAAVIVAGGVAVVSQQRTISALRDDTARAQQQVATLTAENTALTKAAAKPRPILEPLVTPRAPPTARAQPPSTPRTAPPANLPPVPNPYVTPRAEPPPVTLPALPATPEIESQKAAMHRRYDPFFRERGLTPEQAERVVELFVQQTLAREDLQESVRANGLTYAPNERAIEKMRGELYEPITRELREILGAEGYQAYIDYMKMTYYRDGALGSVLREFSAASASLSPEQLDQLIRVVSRNDHPERIRATDIGSRSRIDWDAVLEQSRNLLSPQQAELLASYASQQKTAPR